MWFGFPSNGIHKLNVDGNGKSDAMFAISFDFDTARLRERYGKLSWENAYGEVWRFPPV
jgi:hypothetical protein